MGRGAFALLLSSCSFVSVTPPADPPKPPGDCTTSKSAPNADAVVAVLGGIGIVLGLVIISSAKSCASNGGQDCTAMGGFGGLILIPSAVFGLGWGVSAINGYSNVNECRRRRNEH